MTALKEGLLHIDNKDRVVVPYKLNAVQRLYNQRKGNRNIILKARQMGMSSDELASMFIEAITIPNTTCVVVSHETLATKRLFDRIRFFYDTMPHPKPLLGADSRTEISFPEIHSTIYLGTAGSLTFGRGDRIDHAHLSEIAFYADGERILNAIDDAVPMDGIITLESTPFGEGNIFYETWVKAREGKNSYIPHFFPWWNNPEYTLPPDHHLVLREDRNEILNLDPEEQDLVTKHGLTMGQIRWRRYKIADKGGLFFQEYPEDEVSCFITSGEPVFDSYRLEQMSRECMEGKRHPHGWTYWIEPEHNQRYTIGIDTSAGVPGGSYSAIVVLNDFYEVCATYQGRVDPVQLSTIARQIGEWYNYGELIIERNFTGYTVLSHLNDYPNIYYEKDFMSGKTTGKKGWWTNVRTKEFLMTSLKDKFGQLKIYDINLVRQLRGYRYIKLKPVAQTFDDLVMALMFACAVKTSTGTSRGYMGATAGWSW